MEYQPELFDNSYKNKKLKKSKLNNKHLFHKNSVRFSLSYEQIGLWVIFLVILLSIVFTLGVERGKNISGTKLIKDESIQEKVIEKKEYAKKDEKDDIPIKEVKIQEVKQPEKEETHENGYYTIQVVTYRKDSLAKDEVSYLKKKEYEAFIIDSGKFKHVCVAKFKNRNEANKKLQELRKRYKDCFVRKIE